MSILRTNHITKVYGGTEMGGATNALNGVDLVVEKGEFVGVMGPSGSGKTTLLNILSGIDKATAGEVEIDGMVMSKMEKDQLALFRRQKLGFVFQEFNLLDSLTLKENIMLPMILDRKDGQYMDQKAQEIMTWFGIETIGDKYPTAVSGGQQQRAAVSRALVNDPAIIFADEPTGNLDSKSSKAVMNLLDQINSDLNRTVLMVTHDTFAASFCKRIIFIKDGKIHMEITRHGNRKEFFDRILDCLAVMGGEKNEF